MKELQDLDDGDHGARGGAGRGCVRMDCEGLKWGSGEYKDRSRKFIDMRAPLAKISRCSNGLLACPLRWNKGGGCWLTKRKAELPEQSAERAQGPGVFEGTYAVRPESLPPDSVPPENQRTLP